MAESELQYIETMQAYMKVWREEREHLQAQHQSEISSHQESFAREKRKLIEEFQFKTLDPDDDGQSLLEDLNEKMQKIKEAHESQIRVLKARHEVKEKDHLVAFRSGLPIHGGVAVSPATGSLQPFSTSTANSIPGASESYAKACMIPVPKQTEQDEPRLTRATPTVRWDVVPSTEATAQLRPQNGFAFQSVKPVSCKVSREVADNGERLLIQFQNKPATQKRKATEDAPVAKKARLESPGHAANTPNSLSEQSIPPNDSNAATPTTEQPSPPPPQRTISIEEVRRNGPEKGIWDTIVEWPPKSGKHYILFCEEHQVWMKQNAIAAAAKHLNGRFHNYPNRSFDPAVEALGYLVIGCTHQLAILHNEQVKMAYANGYQPKNGINKNCKHSKKPPTDSQSMVVKKPQPVNKSAKVPPKLSSKPRRFGDGITNPKTYHVYFGLWTETCTMYPVMILGWDNWRPGGIKSSLFKSGLLNEPAQLPECYIYRHDRIVDWAPGYEDGGDYVTLREFPVYYFDQGRSVGWIPASHLTKFPLYQTELPKKTAYRWSWVRDFILEREGEYKTWAEREAARIENRLAPWNPAGHVPSPRCITSDGQFAGHEEDSNFDPTDDEDEYLKEPAFEGDISSDDDYPGEHKIDREGDLDMEDLGEDIGSVDKAFLTYHTRSHTKPGTTFSRPVIRNEDSPSTVTPSKPYLKTDLEGLKAAESLPQSGCFASELPRPPADRDAKSATESPTVQHASGVAKINKPQVKTVPLTSNGPKRRPDRKGPLNVMPSESAKEDPAAHQNTAVAKSDRLSSLPNSERENNRYGQTINGTAGERAAPMGDCKAAEHHWIQSHALSHSPHSHPQCTQLSDVGQATDTASHRRGEKSNFSSTKAKTSSPLNSPIRLSGITSARASMPAGVPEPSISQDISAKVNESHRYPQARKTVPELAPVSKHPSTPADRPGITCSDVGNASSVGTPKSTAKRIWMITKADYAVQARATEIRRADSLSADLEAPNAPANVAPSPATLISSASGLTAITLPSAPATQHAPTDAVSTRTPLSETTVPAVAQTPNHELSYCKIGSNAWERASPKDTCLQLYKSPDGRTMRAHGGPVDLEIDPKALGTVWWETIQCAPDKFSRLTLNFKAAGLEDAVIVFDRSPGSRLSVGKIQTRDFVRWLQWQNRDLKVHPPKLST
ncbi:uncharacterized protein BCR38DRAFT_411362 [Pseudomassariella vexata]|uniref:Uncharacterized protein n=1 Tax=Pseudomassariella vexata TaxID=1141098 RepID=A0A1Y2DQG2_9PEZI|nr:uncharacterized protein BCR38DRAFT_411362 [Pseudomassariella vexata]ORY61490.1 hypothetical protein BCR38DRAFT_411362 [Pseudomassariella vexata]